MRPEKITVVTNFKSVAESHQRVLENLFQEAVEVTTLSFDLDTINDAIDADLLLISLYSIYVEIKKFINENAKVIILSTTITEEQFRRVNEIPKTSQVMLVNYSPEMTLETLALFRQIGLTECDFIPYYPGKPSIPHTDIAVTPGEPDKVPQQVNEIVDIGHRTLDVQTITEVAVYLRREDLLQTEPFVAHFKALKKASNSVSVLLEKAHIMESQFLKLLNVIDEGIIATDLDGTIFAMNHKASEILRLRSGNVGQNIRECIQDQGVEKALAECVTLDHKLIEMNHHYISLKAVPVKLGGLVTSILFVLNKFEEKEKSQHKLRTQILGKGHVAKYTFDDILGDCPAIAETRNMGRRMARSDASVLIVGESGTGKELFAQAIHNASHRREYQFVAVNCAAIPESLLESELFGYEEGAFTGAKKGGKMGLFELAHKGTLFLDEIGEMPIQLQSRLLRVIQEKEVMRIGGDRVIYVDVRIIAATNKNLKKRIKENAFRTDLYYRLNVLTLKLPPLRQRREDILLIFDHLLRESKASYLLSEDARTYLMSYGWEGNLRELKNCVDYLAYLEKAVVTVEDLRKHFDDDLWSEPMIQYQSEDSRGFVLKCLYSARQSQKGIGRRKMLHIAKQENVFITEAEIRNCLQELAEEGLVEVRKGRSGCRLTSDGLRVAMELIE